MQKSLWAIIILMAVGSRTAANAQRPIQVVATLPDLASIAAAVGGEAVVARSIAQGNEDPHFLQARPAFVTLARNADLWIRAGLGLEVGWEPVLMESARNRNILPGERGFLDISEHIPVKLDVATEAVTRAKGDVHPEGNPHYLLDPLNARSAARAIGAKLAELRPDQAAVFRRGAEDFVRRIDEHVFGPAALAQTTGDTLWAKWQEGELAEGERARELGITGWHARLAARRDTRIVTYHKSFRYFAARFGLTIAAQLEPVPGVPPGPAHLASVIERMKSENVGLILLEPFYPRKPADFVAARTGARVAVVSTYAPDTKPDAWFRMMEAIVAAIEGGR